MLYFVVYKKANRYNVIVVVFVEKSFHTFSFPKAISCSINKIEANANIVLKGTCCIQSYLMNDESIEGHPH